MKSVYLDEAATAKYIKSRDGILIDDIVNSMKTMWLNPSSLYSNDVKNIIEECRKNIADFINAKSNEIIFTSGGSESNSMAIRGFIDEHKFHIYKEVGYKPTLVITTKIEHKSILELCENQKLDAYIQYCSVDKNGMVDMNSLNLLLSKYGNEMNVIVSVCMANNEIGTIQDIKAISSLVHKYNGVLHCDCTQAFGHIPINVNDLGIDMLSASGHKISPILRGIGILYKRENVIINPLIFGSQENYFRGGTTNTYGIIGLNNALRHCNLDKESIDKICEKRNYFIDLLQEKFNCVLNGDKCNRLPNNINVTFPQNITSESLLYTLNLSGIKCSVGSACNSHSFEPSHVLREIGLSNSEAMKTIRFSLPEDITYDDIDYVVKEIDKAIKILIM